VCLFVLVLVLVFLLGFRIQMICALFQIWNSLRKFVDDINGTVYCARNRLVEQAQTVHLCRLQSGKGRKVAWKKGIANFCMFMKQVIHQVTSTINLFL